MIGLLLPTLGYVCDLLAFHTSALSSCIPMARFSGGSPFGRRTGRLTATTATSAFCGNLFEVLDAVYALARDRNDSPQWPVSRFAGREHNAFLVLLDNPADRNTLAQRLRVYLLGISPCAFVDRAGINPAHQGNALTHAVQASSPKLSIATLYAVPVLFPSG